MRIRYLNTFMKPGAWIVVVASLWGCGATPTQPARTETKPNASVDALVAESLGTYYLQRDGARSWGLISSAAAQAPERIDIAFLQMRLCQLMDGCQPEPYEARVRKLEPGNAAVWMRVLEDAQRRRDAAVEIQVVDAIGRTERFDVHWNALAASITRARVARGIGADAALNETIRWLAETLVPELTPLSLACSRVRTAGREWAQRCRRIANVLMKGDTYLVETLGTTLAQQVAGETAEQIQLKERARTSRYRWRTYSDLASSQIERNKFAQELIELMTSLRREQDIQLAVVRWANRPVVPPVGWEDG